MEKKKITKFQITTMLLLVVCATICCTAIFGSSEQVAKADVITETNGYYSFNMSRLTLPCIKKSTNVLNNASTYSLSVASMGFIITDTNRTENIALSSFYYSSGIAGDTMYIEQTAPYRQEHSYTFNHIFYDYIELPTSGSVVSQIPYAVFVSNGFFANIESIELGNIYDNNDDVIINETIHSELDSAFTYWGYIRFTCVNGSYMIIAFQTGHPSLTTIAGHTAAEQSNLNTRAFPVYRKYWLNFNTDKVSYDKGYATGYLEGAQNGDDIKYEQGYNDGYNEGYDTAIEEDAGRLATFSGWAQSVLDMLNVPIFGTFSLATIIGLIAGISLLFFLLNLLKG